MTWKKVLTLTSGLIALALAAYVLSDFWGALRATDSPPAYIVGARIAPDYPTEGQVVEVISLPGTALKLLICEIDPGSYEAAIGTKMEVFTADPHPVEIGARIHFRYYQVSNGYMLRTDWVKIAITE